MKIEVTVCNVCKDPGRVILHSYTLTRDDGEVTQVDLCKEDDPALATFFGIASKRASSPRVIPSKKAARKVASSSSRAAGRTPIMTLDEIEQAKAAKAH